MEQNNQNIQLNNQVDEKEIRCCNHHLLAKVEGSKIIIKCRSCRHLKEIEIPKIAN